jgi:hypothetical protein
MHNPHCTIFLCSRSAIAAVAPLNWSWHLRVTSAKAEMMLAGGLVSRAVALAVAVLR